MSYKDADYVSRLDRHGWIEIHEPLPRRREYTDQADGSQEFLQGESYESYRYRCFGERNAVSLETKIKDLQGGNPQNEIDYPSEPWPWE